MVYLDNAATTFPKPEKVYQAMDNANRELAVNAGRGSYRLAREATRLIDDTKERMIKLINADMNAFVVFSPSITVAMNQIINGIAWQKNAVIYVSPYEHNAVARTLNYICKKEIINLKEIPINNTTLEIDIEKMRYVFSREIPSAVFCTHISNVTGYILPVKEIFEEAKKYNCITILDSAQSLGLIEVNCREIDVDIIAFTGHKSLYGPLGIGGFVNISGLPMKEYIVGGTGSDSLNLDMPQMGSTKFESASSNIVAIRGLNAALEEVNPDTIYAKEKKLTNYLIAELEAMSEIKLFLPKNREKHIGIVSFAVDGYCSEDVGNILDEDFDIAVRTGYHCAPYIHRYLGDMESLGTVRVGIGQFNCEEDVDKLIQALRELF